MSALQSRTRSLLVASTLVIGTATGVLAGAPASNAGPGCSSTTVSLPEDSSAPAIPVTVCTGVSSQGNGAWIVEEPAGYATAQGSTPATRTLLLWSHGFRAAFDTDHSAADYPQGSVPNSDGGYLYGDVTHYALLADGYALAGSAYGSNGWAVNDGVRADKELLTSIVPAELSAAPKHVYAWGESLGGLITQMLAQRDPTLIDGAFPQCGVLAGSVAIGDKFVDAEVAAKLFFDHKLQLSGYKSDKAAENQETAVQNDIVAKLITSSTQAATVQTLVGLDLLLGLPLKTYSYNDKHSELSLAFAATESFLTQVGYGIEGERDVVQRAGGLPVTNVGIDYSALATKGAQKAYATYGYKASGLVAMAKELQDKAVRVKDSPAARKKFAGMGVPSGALSVPTLTMHTEYDPLVVVQNETVFADNVAKHHDSKLLEQIFVKPQPGSAWGSNSDPPQPSDIPAYYGAGHCNFSSSQVIAGVEALNTWVTTGKKPTPASIAGLTSQIDEQYPELPGDPATGIDPSYKERPWPRSAL